MWWGTKHWLIVISQHAQCWAMAAVKWWVVSVARYPPFTARDASKRTHSYRTQDCYPGTHTHTEGPRNYHLRLINSQKVSPSLYCQLIQNLLFTSSHMPHTWLETNFSLLLCNCEIYCWVWARGIKQPSCHIITYCYHKLGDPITPARSRDYYRKCPI